MAEPGWRRYSCIGVDIGVEKIKCMQLRTKKKKLFLDRYGVTDTPEEGVTDKINKPQEVAYALRNLIKKKRFRGRNAVLSLPVEAVLIREAELPPMPPKEMAEAIRWEAGRYINLPPEQIVVDYLELESTDVEKRRVLLVAAPREIIDSYINMCDLAGLFTLAIEVEPFSLGRAQRQVVLNSQEEASEETEWIICLDIGRDKVGLLILHNGQYAFSRSFNRPREDKIGDELVQEIHRSIEYYLYKLGHREAAIHRIYVTGGHSKQDGLHTLLSQGLSMEVHLLNPFTSMEHDRRYINSLLDADAPLFGIAFGLALRGYQR